MGDRRIASDSPELGRNGPLALSEVKHRRGEAVEVPAARARQGAPRRAAMATRDRPSVRPYSSGISRRIKASSDAAGVRRSTGRYDCSPARRTTIGLPSSVHVGYDDDPGCGTLHRSPKMLNFDLAKTAGEGDLVRGRDVLIAEEDPTAMLLVGRSIAANVRRRCVAAKLTPRISRRARRHVGTISMDIGGSPLDPGDTHRACGYNRRELPPPMSIREPPRRTSAAPWKGVAPHPRHQLDRTRKSGFRRLSCGAAIRQRACVLVTRSGMHLASGNGAAVPDLACFSLPARVRVISPPIHMTRHPNHGRGWVTIPELEPTIERPGNHGVAARLRIYWFMTRPPAEG